MTTRKCVLQTWLLVCAAANLHIPGRNVIVNVNVSLNAVLLHTVNYIGSIPVGGFRINRSINEPCHLDDLQVCELFFVGTAIAVLECLRQLSQHFAMRHPTQENVVQF